MTNSDFAFDKESSLVFSGFDDSYGTDDVRSLLSWFCPVIYVEGVKNGPGTYVVVFASNCHSKTLLQLGKITLGGDLQLTIKTFAEAFEDGSYSWTDLSEILTSGSSAAAPILDIASQGITSAINTLGGYTWGGLLGNG